MTPQCHSTRADSIYQIPIFAADGADDVRFSDCVATAAPLKKNEQIEQQKKAYSIYYIKFTARNA